MNALSNPEEENISEVDDPSPDIAIIGMAGRFPGASNIDEFWANVRDGVESIQFLTPEELLAAGVSRRDFESPDYVPACPVLEDIDKFDAAFFGISPRDASVMDPAHRIFLELAWQALEHSGNTGLPEEGRVGVYAGSGAPLYWANNVKTNKGVMQSMGEFLVRHTANDMNFLATRVSYDLDLRGPSLNIQTACSSALVSLHQARVSLLRKECDIALVGGSTVVLPMGHGYFYKEGEILSPDGHCRPFDANSAGTVFGSGAACLVVKRLDDALDNGDTIHAIVKGSAINNDGAVKVGYLAPGVDGQVGVIDEALETANVSADSISYVETHGTGTAVGDPIELTALDQSFSKQTQRKQFCAVGSVKSNIGHLGEAAAAASLIKAVMALKHRQLPPSLGYEKPNPRFDFEDSAFFVNTQVHKWEDGGEPLRCGVTALGAGGTNCHVILEEAPESLAGEGERDRQLLVLSAKNRAALDRMTENLANALQEDPSQNLADVAYTLALGRRPLDYRRVLVAQGVEDALEALRSTDARLISTTAADTSSPGLVFTFPGGGAQYAGMGKGLYDQEEIYREAVDECLATVDGLLDIDLRDLLFATSETQEAATQKLTRPSLSLPALFTTEYALARLFESWGLTASAMIGHSMGEYVAACLAGVFTVEEGVRLVCKRGELFETTERGTMVAVSLSEDETRKRMPEGLSIAAVNAPDLCVASGPVELVQQLRETLTAEDIDWTQIHIDVAAHSTMLEPILGEFREFCQGIPFQVPQRPLTSNLTGGWLTADQATDPEYWVQHLRNTVRFADCVETVLEQGDHVFLELGPGRTLSTLVTAQKTRVPHSVNSIRHIKEEANDVSYALMSAGKIWAAGVDLDWTAFYDEQLRNRIPLPVYPFDKISYWLEPQVTAVSEETDLVKREDMDQWFYTTSWVPSPLIPLESETTNWLIVCDSQAVSKEVSQRLYAAGAETVVVVVKDKTIHRVGRLEWRLNPANPAHFRELLEALDSEGKLPQHTAYLLGLDDESSVVQPGLSSKLMKFASSQFGFGSKLSINSANADDGPYMGLIYLAKSLAVVCEGGQLSVITSRALRLNDEPLVPSRRLLMGAALVFPREVPELKLRFVDALGNEAVSCVEAVTRELCAESKDDVVVLRGAGRWCRTLPQIHLPPADGQLNGVKDNSVVVISGGLGGIGLVIGKHLAKCKGIRLVLLARTPLPPRSEWPALLASTGSDRGVRKKLEAILEMEEAGAEVSSESADVCNIDSLNLAAERIRKRFGSINVLIHAAGALDDGPFQTKLDESIKRVLAPKVQGTINLDQAMGQELDLFVLFSSVASLLGLPGQVDYAAANAFLDAFAEERESRCPGRTLVINWNAWRDVGMVADVIDRQSNKPLPAATCSHPLLGGKESMGVGTRVALDLSIAKDWLLSEHQIRGGAALIPGTGFIELVRAAFAEDHAGDAIEISDVTFLAPFQVAQEQVQRMDIELIPVDNSIEATIKSMPENKVHMTASLAVIEYAIPPSLELAEIQQRCVESNQPDGGFLDQQFVDFGPRWGNIKRISTGSAEALLELELPQEFAADLPAFAYHPAVMDMATGAAQHLLPGFRADSDFFVPFAYESVRIYSALTRQCFSHVRLRPQTMSDIAVFDVTVTNTEGQCLIEIAGFTMKRTHKEDAILQQASNTPTVAVNQALEEILREAITPEEGVVAFERILNQTQVPKVIASSVDVNLWLNQLDNEATRLSEDEQGEDDTGFSRPDLGTDYVAPEGALEESLVSMWSKLLGVQAPGVLDDFFELGGNSLIAVRFFARVKKQLGASLPISTLFQAPTIRGLGELLAQQGVELSGQERIKDAGKRQFIPFSQLSDRARRSKNISFPTPAEAGLFHRQWDKTELLSVPDPIGGLCWLIFMDDAGLGQRLRQRLTERGDTVIQVRDSDSYSRLSATDYTVVPEGGRESYDALVRDLAESGTFPTHMLHMWLVTKDTGFRPGSSFFHRTQERGFYSLLFLEQALADAEVDSPLDVHFATSSTLVVLDGEGVHDSKGSALGPLACLESEMPRLRARHIDVLLPPQPSDSAVSQQLTNALKDTAPEERSLDLLAEQLLAEVTNTWEPLAVALRQDARYRTGFAVVGAPVETPISKVADGIYLLLGTPSHFMCQVACALLTQVSARFALIHNPLLNGQDDAARMLSDYGISADELHCDLTNPEHLGRCLQKLVGNGQEVRGAMLGSWIPPMTLMQLTESGAVEEHLAQQVQVAQNVTAALRQYPTTFTILFGSKPDTSTVGSSAHIAGLGFLGSHAAHCQEQGQSVVSVFESATQLTSAGVNQIVDDTALELVRILQDPKRMKANYWFNNSQVISASNAPQLTLDAVLEEPIPPASEDTTDLEVELLSLWQAASTTEKIGRASRFSEIGLSILDSARLMTHVKNRFQLPQSVGTLIQNQSIAATARFIADSATGGEDINQFKHLVPMHPSNAGAGQPFYVVAGMFGNILNLRHLGHLLGVDRKIYGVQARGLLGDEMPHNTIEEMAEAYLAEIRIKQPEGPYALGGFSGGGLTAYEMAKRLQQEGEEVSLLAMLDTPLPQREPLTTRDRAMIQWLNIKKEGLSYIQIWARKRAAWEVQRFRERFHRVDETYRPDAFNTDAIGEAFLSAAENYQVGGYRGKLTLFTAEPEKEWEVAPGRFVNRERSIILKDHGWSAHVDELEVIEVPGDHDHIVLEPEVRVLADKLRLCLKQME